MFGHDNCSVYSIYGRVASSSNTCNLDGGAAGQVLELIPCRGKCPANILLFVRNKKFGKKKTITSDEKYKYIY